MHIHLLDILAPRRSAKQRSALVALLSGLFACACLIWAQETTPHLHRLPPLPKQVVPMRYITIKTESCGGSDAYRIVCTPLTFRKSVLALYNELYRSDGLFEEASKSQQAELRWVKNPDMVVMPPYGLTQEQVMQIKREGYRLKYSAIVIGISEDKEENRVDFGCGVSADDAADHSQ